MAISDAQFRWSVIGASLALAVGLASVRFCGSVALPPKQSSKAPVTGNANQLMTKTSGTQSIYLDFLAKDANAAGARVPTIDEMRLPFASTLDETRRLLEVGAAATQVDGLALAAVRSGDAIVLDIHNTTDKDLGYLVRTTPTPATACNTARVLSFNAMVIPKGQHVQRVECVHRPNMVIAVNRVETIAVSPLSAWYLSQTPPELVGIEERIARGHRSPRSRDDKEKCSPLMGEALRSRIESGEIRWRDLADFYARHRCQTFHFPMSYQAFTENDPRTLPITE